MIEANRVAPLEAMVLAGLAEGKTRSQLALDLGVSEYAIGRILKGAADRLGAQSEAHAVVLYDRQTGRASDG